MACSRLWRLPWRKPAKPAENSTRVLAASPKLWIAPKRFGKVTNPVSTVLVTPGLKQGRALSAPPAETGLFPPMALSFLRTGEETAQLGMMLNRLADVLDRDVRTAIQRMIAFMTPAITVLMGAVVATVIASIMSAILGFNDLALGP